MTSPVTRISYSPNLFVDRREQIDLVCDNIRQLLDPGPDMRQHVIDFTGMVGEGKSWLLAHLQTEIAQRFTAIFSFRLCFSQCPDPATPTPPRAFHRIINPRAFPDSLDLTCAVLQWLIREVLTAQSKPVRFVQSTEAAALRERLESELTAWPSKIVILMDGLDEIDPAALKSLETHCLAPLAKRSDMLLVLSHRRPEIPGYVRDRTLNRATRNEELKPFGSDDTEKQLDATNSLGPAARHAGRIYELSGGHPQTNILLALAVDPESGNWMDEGLALQQASDILLASVEDPVMHQCLTTVSVLRRLDIPRLQALLAATSIAREAWNTDYQALTLLRHLSLTSLIFPDYAATEDRVFLMDDALRRVLHNRLRVCERTTWERLHRIAEALYTQWMVDYPRYLSTWKAETDYHTMCLANPDMPV